jgi:hypothetical protein
MAMPTPPLTLIDQLRRMVAEPTQDTYTDDLLGSYLAAYPLPDSAGALPTDTAWLGAWDANLQRRRCGRKRRRRLPVITTSPRTAAATNAARYTRR